MKSTLRRIEDWTGLRDPVARAIAKGLLLGAALIAIATLTSCTLTVTPDGTRTYATDPNTFLRAIDTLSNK